VTSSSFSAKKHGNKVFFPSGITGSVGGVPVQNLPHWGSTDPEAFQRWVQGQTGYPLVDANMREMAMTGYMSNRGRQNVASFLIHDMGHDWRAGARYFESVLLDYDVASNWGNWVAAAGLTGGRVNRFNILKQSKDYDASGEYVRHWVPELRALPPSLVHNPSQMSAADQARYGVKIGIDYPKLVGAATKSYQHREDWHSSKKRGSHNSNRNNKNYNTSNRHNKGSGGATTCGISSQKHEANRRRSNDRRGQRVQTGAY